MIKSATAHWQKKGVTLHVLATAPQKGIFAEILADEGIIIQHIPFRKSLRFLWDMVNFLHEKHYDAVHLHVEQTALTYALLAKLAGVPITLRTIHGHFMFTGFTRVVRSIKRWMMRRLGVIQVSISERVHQNEQKRFHNTTRLISNWIDDAQFYPPSDQERTQLRSHFRLANEDKVLVSIGNCHAVKNHSAIIDTLPLLQLKETRLSYWHIGEEDADQIERRKVEALGLQDRVKFWGWQKDVRPLLWAADVFVMPSYQEGFGIAALEALACGMPVVLSRSSGMEDWSHQFSGITLSETTPAGLARSIDLVIQNNPLTNWDNANLVKSRFGVKSGAEAYFNLYRGNPPA